MGILPPRGWPAVFSLGSAVGRRPTAKFCGRFLLTPLASRPKAQNLNSSPRQRREAHVGAHRTPPRLKTAGHLDHVAPPPGPKVSGNFEPAPFLRTAWRLGSGRAEGSEDPNVASPLWGLVKWDTHGELRRAQSRTGIARNPPVWGVVWPKKFGPRLGRTPGHTTERKNSGLKVGRADGREDEIPEGALWRTSARAQVSGRQG